MKEGQAVQITGGEPVIYPYLFELLEYISKKGMYAFLATSGHGYSHEVYEKMKECGITVICVSINDIEETANKQTRDMYEESILAIRAARECGLCCFVNVIVTDDNIARLETLVKYLKTMGAEGICILRPVKSFDNQYIPKLSNDTLNRLHELAKQSLEYVHVEKCFGEYWEHVNGRPFQCEDIGRQVLFVNADGSVSPCSKLTKYKYGNIQEMEFDHENWKRGCYGIGTI